MTYNTIGYMIYLPATAYITIIVGKAFHKNGIHYILSDSIPDQLAHSANNLLLVGYYLVNIGYAFASIVNWHNLISINQLIEELSFRLAFIILFLAFLHYINLSVIALWKYLQKHNKISTN